MFQQIVELHGNFFTGDAGKHAQEALLNAGTHHQFLNHHFGVIERRGLFHVTIKTHMVQRIGEHCQEFNPRTGATYNDEDFMGKVSAIATASLRARGPLRVGMAVSVRYRKLLALKWARFSQGYL